MKGRKLLLIVLAIIWPCVLLKGQDEGKTFRQDDVWRIFRSKEKRASNDSIVLVAPKLFDPMIAVTPFVGYNPAYGFLIGVGSTIGMYLGKPETTPISSASLSINITTKSQKIFNLRTNIITKSSRFILRGDWRYLIFSQPTYGLGTGIDHTDHGVIFSDGGQTDAYSGETQLINYDYIRVYETFFFRIYRQFYGGFGFNFDDYTHIQDTRLNLDTVPQQITSHYKYCKENEFDTGRQRISGISLELLIDSRDNTIRPTKGYLANIAFRPNFTWLGSSRNSVMLNTEFRTYISLSRRRPDHLVGFWYIGQFTQKGKVPYLGLPAIAWDMYNRTGRGYVQGSIRGINFLYGETEYRFPISRYTGILGGVVFLNATTASSDDGSRNLFEYIDPGGGIGLRVMFNRQTLSNLTVDLGFGRNGTIGVYFNLNETF